MQHKREGYDLIVVYVSDKHKSHVCVVVWVSNSKKNNVTNKNRELVVGPQVKKSQLQNWIFFPVEPSSQPLLTTYYWCVVTFKSVVGCSDVKKGVI